MSEATLGFLLYILVGLDTYTTDLTNGYKYPQSIQTGKILHLIVVDAITVLL